MRSVFICKTRIDVITSLNNENNLNNFVRIANIEKFALRTYNRLIHNREINDYFVANCLIKLSKYYIFFKEMKKFYLNVFCRIFAFILFSDFVDTSNGFIRFEKFKSLFETMYNYYRWKNRFLINTHYTII